MGLLKSSTLRKGCVGRGWGGGQWKAGLIKSEKRAGRGMGLVLGVRGGFRSSLLVSLGLL